MSRDIDAAGTYRLRLRPKGPRRARIARRRSFRARVTIVATDSAGTRRIVKRSVRVARKFGRG